MTGDEPIYERERTPNTTDYLAGGMLANGFVWIWNQALAKMDIFSRIPPNILADVSFIVYFLGAFLASNLVCKRASSKHLSVGIKFALISWVMSLIIMLSMVAESTIGYSFSMLLLFLGGGITSSYLATRARLKKVDEGSAKE
jgi:hypothetical protein